MKHFVDSANPRCPEGKRFTGFAQAKLSTKGLTVAHKETRGGCGCKNNLKCVPG